MKGYVEWLTVTFNTTTDDKDFDTVVDMTLSSYKHGIRGEVIAFGSSTFGGYLAKNSTSLAQNLLFEHLPWGIGEEHVLTVSIEPVGHDTWKFDCFLRIQFTTGTKDYAFQGHALSQDVRSNDYVFTM